VGCLRTADADNQQHLKSFQGLASYYKRLCTDHLWCHRSLEPPAEVSGQYMDRGVPGGSQIDSGLTGCINMDRGVPGGSQIDSGLTGCINMDSGLLGVFHHPEACTDQGPHVCPPDPTLLFILEHRCKQCGHGSGAGPGGPRGAESAESDVLQQNIHQTRAPLLSSCKSSSL
jgi:hypothetical protein